MKGEWCYFESRWTANQCQSIINEIKTRPAEVAALGVNGERKDNDYRRSNIRFIQPNDPVLSWVFDDLWKMAIQVNDEGFGFHISKLGYVQIAEYEGSARGEYKVHHDVFYLNNSDYHRKLSAIVQLSDPVDYDGGDFRIYETDTVPNADAIKKQGTAVFFPAFIRHAALPVTRGTRYSLAAWFDGKRWT